ncbi:uncharacterized protein PHACADRAFT_201718 [Phanerochaete carnosa HHB-10118-sp]|uniref:JmjC domain-containing protein n=1 Tax=Phanerochaete carnosa (strain HHB-10118-sp) TaxID=650164 RepID=K5UIU9_PHACS|nr:uncharacterized protein PHACADRAFT_201718 [Phanerochaete carnosa HHB-10118-sp]EKM49456.1 hypothetical protein PHACADRAFT_201718 [Phanerochaete carnosa HHB-10118-sp]
MAPKNLTEVDIQVKECRNYGTRMARGREPLISSWCFIVKPHELFVFESIWEAGLPAVVTGIKFSKIWSLDELTKAYGKEELNVIEVDKEGGESEVRRSLEEFLHLLFSSDSYFARARDIPVAEDFHAVFKEVSKDFDSSLPYRSITSFHGLQNLAAHWLKLLREEEMLHNGWRRPDIGSKGYAASRDHHHTGSTKLHKDMCAAVNLMLLCSPDPQTNDQGAVWHIFMASDSETVSQYLHEKNPGSNQHLDPAHSCRLFLTDSMLAELYKQHQVRPFRVVQRTGDAVIIPPGCLHQVSNLGPCVKVAMDFLGIEGLDQTLQVNREFRREGINSSLQPMAMLWYAWQSLSNLRAMQLQKESSSDTKKRPASTNRESSSQPKQKRLKAEQTNDLSASMYLCPHEDCAVKQKKWEIQKLYDHLRGKHKTIIPAQALLSILKQPRTGWARAVEAYPKSPN